MSVTYTDPNKVEAVATSVDTPLLRSANGYGSKLPTAYLVAYKHNNNRVYRHRVYAMCYGNSAIVYIVVEGHDMFLDIDTEYALQDGIPHPNLV